MQVTPHVYVMRVRVAPYPEAYSPNVFLVVDGGQAVMIDAGFPDDESIRKRLEYVESLGVTVEQIVVTHHHYDHAAGAGRLREATGARVLMHPVEERLLREAAERPSTHRSEQELALRRLAGEITVDGYVQEGDSVAVGDLILRVIEAPGHSAAHLCLLLEEEGILFSGDNVVGLGTTAIPPPPQGDMRLYLESLRRMLALDAKIVCPGHGPIVHQPAKKIQELIDHRRERDEQVLGLIAQGKDSLGEIVRGIYPELDPRLEPAARGQVLSHLYKLRDEGRVTFHEEGDEVYCRLTG